MSQRVTRRQFLNYSLMGVGSFMAAGMILPMGRFALDPVFKADAQGDLIATGVKESELGKEPIKVDFKFEQEDAWYTSEVTEFAWVYKDGKDIVALSPVCKHLGCTVTWNGDDSNPNQFYCPCHNGRYEKNGKNIPGTPPLAPLDQYEVKVKDGIIQIGKKHENELAK
ncbi:MULTISPECIES: ubiquinol-cytochrome c reductase iron-sulfur subunit [Mammaliicoccus]|uniref:Menaquinol:cytochrome c reductase iron-sulfur subunit n=1 Tax=Mammaliicoccus vitulinus TaxID=71237 RepID=A0A2T4PUB0_9STAP|nr:MULTISPECIES: ubiquinol-cytochrome c reductase iron-sulfur subunit [Mammaliicoccus]HAL10148.1 ubiquinol-cytochrome c reductase iron-sulfur subunit [Staphylococcus sp.]MBM6628097.1 ubiquinol-cytochrome c reductase iron-sulfur subunit [Mammaliicoccus vitulinus]MBO3077122.1 ubiquinol-cytochrome c reductase iron-sulfur subunit [Mammaliicoccus vitulinus]MEB7656790.1 ubiquinol-cytochrome c reductase iron-sulfur subunit [Mammaliicoccus vitulinus]PNZ40884.1 menaquinol-cytochrome C reductase [Mammal